MSGHVYAGALRTIPHSCDDVAGDAHGEAGGTDVSLSPEIRRRIYEEEQVRVEAQERIREEIRLRHQNTAFALRMLLVLVFFALGFFVSEHYLKQSQAVPEISAPPREASPHVSQAVLDEIAQSLKPQVEADVCVRATGRTRPQVKATIELARDTWSNTARRLAMAKAKVVGATLRKRGLAIPAYVEIFSPKRWYGLAVYDSDTLQITWDACPGRCEEEGTRHVRRCRE